MGGEGGLITGPKKRFKTSYMAVLVKILFEFTHFIQARGGGRLISEGFTLVDPEEGSGPTLLKNVQSGTQAP